MVMLYCGRAGKQVILGLLSRRSQDRASLSSHYVILILKCCYVSALMLKSPSKLFIDNRAHKGISCLLIVYGLETI